jgi:hypothetical protein
MVGWHTLGQIAMNSIQHCLLALLAIAATSCSEATIDPSVAFNEQGCSSSSVERWPSISPVEIEVSNNTQSVVAVVMGTYKDGFGTADLIAYGSDVSIRPDFINALEIHQAAPGITNTLLFDHGPGTFFMVCMPDTSTMVVLKDVTVDG